MRESITKKIDPYGFIWIQPIFFLTPWFRTSEKMAMMGLFFMLLSAIIFNIRVKRTGDTMTERTICCFLGSFIIGVIAIVITMVWTIALNFEVTK
jgi:hypothetical protein